MLANKKLSDPLPDSSYQGWRHRLEQARIQRSEQHHWFVLRTEPLMERKACAQLTADRFKAYLPEESIYTTRGVRRRKVAVLRPLFRGYLFVRLSPHLDGRFWNHVACTRGVHGFMRSGDGYAVVPDPVMARIAGISTELQKPKPIRGPSAIFGVGEQVRIADGPFSGLNAEIAALDDEQRISVLLPLLGRIVRTHLAAEQLEKL